MKTNLLITFLLVTAMTFGQQTGEVIVTEIHNRPQKPTQQQLDDAITAGGITSDATPNEGHTEWFEIYNTTGSPVVMDGWMIVDESSSSNVTTIGSFTLGVGQYAMFTGFYIPEAQGGIIPDYVYDYKKPSFNNESSYDQATDSSCPDGVSIYKADGTTLVDTVEYDYGYNVSTCVESQDTDHDFPPQGSSSNVAFMLKVGAPLTATDNDVASNWEYATLTYDGTQIGTPGKANDQDATLSTSDKLFNAFKIYPNPVSNYINIQSKTVKISSVELYSVLGKIVLSQKEVTNDRLDISNISNGIYFMKINAEGSSTTKKIVIK
ncbi:T9SS type A sorting domain-containing protein [Flavobacteriaceae bacterium LMO-SS05]|jgi:hypothetical protein